ncbi:MAG: N-6 DNA methylase [Rhodobacteraceae bacterium]|nr:N-6 DNA methylase [Paracoccaceae bacterium]
MIDYGKIVANHGGDPASFLGFEKDGDQVNLLPYATLTAARSSVTLSAIVGVYEWQNGPLFMLVDGEAIGDDPNKLSELRRIVAMRGDAPYLAVHRTGSLTFHNVGLDNTSFDKTHAFNNDIKDVGMVIPFLVHNRPSSASKITWIHDVILNLLTKALDGLVRIGVDDGDAISLVGRALFTRFLGDRGLLPDEAIELGKSGIHTLFVSHESVSKISYWLDKTFNGDFLPLSDEKIQALPHEAFSLVSNILDRAVDGQLSLDWSEDWAKLDFSHIPVGVLSQAYERYLGHHQKEKQRKEGSYYTPRHIADLMVHASFAALQRQGTAVSAKVLDPAAGAGVFLITAFRRLVKERWEQDGQRPDTKALREILYEQIRGFDINDSALRFAALGLYLISIELDASPKPVEKLRFERDLRQTVIFKLGKDDNLDGSKDLGSLGDEVGVEHNGMYDLVIGNPPWASATNLENWQSVKYRVSKIARVRSNNEKITAPLPNEALDLPFVWRAMEWVKPSGQIALALHARLLFQRGEGMDKALLAICQSIDITGIINGSEVRQSRVWPNIGAPFCLLFARNTTPPPGASFRFVSPHLEGPLNQAGGWRIDVGQSTCVSVDDLNKRPQLLKILFRGTTLDLEIYDRVAAKGYPTFGRTWQNMHGGTEKRPKNSGMGYKLLHAGSQPNSADNDKLGQSAEAMFEFPILPNADFSSILLDTEHYQKFKTLGLTRLDRARPLSLYSGPMLVVHKSPPADAGRIRTAVSLTQMVFNESFYGYTAHSHELAADLVKYLSLVVSSNFALWYSLMTSGEFGFERDVIEKYIIQEIPLPPFSELSPEDRNQVNIMFDELAEGETFEKWRKVDEWVGSLFDMTPDDVQTISDTLDFALPFAANKKAAQAPISAKSKKAYAVRLELELESWGARFDRKLSVRPIDTSPLSPWQFVAISSDARIDQWVSYDEVLMHAIQEAADGLSSSEIVYLDVKNDCLYLGRLNQARYWSISQARLAARRIIWENIDFLSGKLAE